MLRIGSLAAGVVSVALIVAQHFLFLNPLFTDESTGKIPVFNLLFLAYLLPAIAAAALALYARNKRPKWYSAMLGLLGSVLVFVYATLSVRRLFQGEHIGWWAGMSQLETYSYSALWLAMGVGLLVAGVWLKSHVLRVASAVLIAVAVAKVFIFDMSELEGVLRALSFIGLGAVLIGIGLVLPAAADKGGEADDVGAISHAHLARICKKEYMNIQERDIHMPLYIRDDEVDLLAAELQSVSGARTKTEAVRIALQNEIKRKRAEMPLIDRIARIQEKVRKLGPRDPDFDMKKFSDELSGDI